MTRSSINGNRQSWWRYHSHRRLPITNSSTQSSEQGSWQELKYFEWVLHLNFLDLKMRSFLFYWSLLFVSDDFSMQEGHWKMQKEDSCMIHVSFTSYLDKELVRKQYIAKFKTRNTKVIRSCLFLTTSPRRSLKNTKGRCKHFKIFREKERSFSSYFQRLSNTEMVVVNLLQLTGVDSLSSHEHCSHVGHFKWLLQTLKLFCCFMI